MSRPVVVLRPEPGNAATVLRLQAAGLRAVSLPLFRTHALEWAVPQGAFDALLLTSATTVRLAGEKIVGLDQPVVAVGEATAAAARRLGLAVAITGTGGAADVVALAEASGLRRLLHLGAAESGRPGGALVASVAVYTAEPLALDKAATRSALRRTVTLVHSPRAGRRVAALAGRERASIRLVAISAAAAAAAGSGWEAVLVAHRPHDEAMMELARRLAD